MRAGGSRIETGISERSPHFETAFRNIKCHRIGTIDAVGPVRDDEIAFRIGPKPSPSLVPNLRPTRYSFQGSSTPDPARFVFSWQLSDQFYGSEITATAV